MLQCRCSGTVVISGSTTTIDPLRAHTLSVAVLPSWFLAFSLVALRVLGLKNYRAEGVNQPSPQLVTICSLLI